MMSVICNNSFRYVLRIIILDVSETAQEKARGNNSGLLHVPSKGSLLLPATVYRSIIMKLQFSTSVVK